MPDSFDTWRGRFRRSTGGGDFLFLAGCGNSGRLFSSNSGTFQSDSVDPRASDEAAVGAPQCGQAVARFETEPPQSSHSVTFLVLGSRLIKLRFFFTLSAGGFFCDTAEFCLGDEGVRVWLCGWNSNFVLQPGHLTNRPTASSGPVIRFEHDGHFVTTVI